MNTFTYEEIESLGIVDLGNNVDACFHETVVGDNILVSSNTHYNGDVIIYYEDGKWNVSKFDSFDYSFDTFEEALKVAYEKSL